MNEKILAKWGKLGVALYNQSNEELDPELLFIESIKLFENDRKLLSLVTSWLIHFSDLIHIKKIRNLSKNLEEKELMWIHGFGNKLSLRDRRWSLLKGSSDKKTFVTTWDELQGQRIGLDPDFEKAGLRLANFKENYENKILPYDFVVRNNTIFTLRSLFGTNWRADLIWMKIYFPDLSLYTIAKNLGCSTETLYRTDNQLKLIGYSNLTDLVQKLMKKFEIINTPLLHNFANPKLT